MEIGVTDNFTPTITFGTPGDLSVTYERNAGRYIRTGEIVLVYFSIVTSSFTHSTSAGALLVDNFPYFSRYEPSATHSFSFGNLSFNGITKADYTHFAPAMNPLTKTMFIGASGSGQVVSTVTSLDTPSGGTLTLFGGIYYIASDLT